MNLDELTVLTSIKESCKSGRIVVFIKCENAYLDITKFIPEINRMKLLSKVEDRLEEIKENMDK